MITLSSAANDVTFTIAGDVTTTSGEIEVNAGAAGTGVITMADNGTDNTTVFNAGDDLIDINGVGDVTLGRLITTNSSDVAVTITTSAAVIDGGDSEGEDVEAASGRLVIDAATGVGSTAADGNLDTEVASLDVGNTTCSKGEPHVPPHGCRDYRPRTPEDGAVVPSPTSVFAFEGNGSATLRNVVARFEGSAPYWLPPSEGGLCRELAGGGWAVRQEGATRLPCVETYEA